MTRTVELPLWALVLILAFAAVTFASHFLFPSVRWFFRRRMERAVTELNKRLDRPIQPFKLARRHDMIQRSAAEAGAVATKLAEAKTRAASAAFKRPFMVGLLSANGSYLRTDGRAQACVSDQL